MKRPRLFCWCDMISPTGFANVSKNLLRDMYQHFDVHILGINYHGLQNYDTSKYFVYPIDRTDPLGLRRMPEILKNVNPELIFLFQDIFHIDLALPVVKQNCPNVPIAAYFPIDGWPYNVEWETPLKEISKIFTYTEFGRNTILERFPEYADKVGILYHGIDTEVFYPLEEKIIRIVQRNNAWIDRFVAVNVNRFQPRKMIDLSAYAFYMFYKGYKICDDCDHYYPAEQSECNLCHSKVVSEEKSGHKDVTLYLHMMPQEYSMGPGKANTLLAHMRNIGFTDDDVKKGALQINNRRIYEGDVSEEEVNEFYNGASVNITSTVGEGFGLSLAESAAAGRTSIAPNNSAIPEVLGDTGHLIPNKSWVSIALDNGHIRPLVDVGKMTEALEIEYKKWEENGRKNVFNQDAYDRVQQMFLWDDKREILLKALQEIV